MSPQQYPNLNTAQDSTFLVPSPPTQLSLTASYFGGERKSFPELGFENRVGNEEGEGEEEEEEEEESKYGQVKLCARGHWRPHEDAKLKELVALHGPQNWNLIAEKLDGRSGKSCRLRWFNQLDPRINKRSFNEEEEERLLAAHRMYGNKWAHIARLFPGRTDNSVKNHWHVIMARRHRENNSIYRRRKPSSSSSPSSSASLSPCRHRQIGVVDAESGSTCTELSLSPPSSGFSSFSLSRFGHIGSSTQKNLTTTNVGFDQFHNSGRPNKAMDQSGNSDSNSNSEITASDSVVAKNMTNYNLFMMGFDHESCVVASEKNNRPFIDFLGVGPTF